MEKQKYSFGHRAEIIEGQDCFVSYLSQEEDRNCDHNPYNKKYWNSPENYCSTDSKSQITSIPSPYARMHITNLAFYEILLPEDQLVVGPNAPQKPIPHDYKCAVSYCLDMFELLFLSNNIDLAEKGIRIEKLKLVTPAESRGADVEKYITTLDLFRTTYKNQIAQLCRNNNVDFHFDFSSLYIIYYNNRPIMATSPYTGFFSISESGNYNTGIVLEDVHGQKRKAFTNDDKEIRLLKDRSIEFLKFMYMLLKHTGLMYVYENLFKAVQQSGINCDELDQIQWNAVEEYRRFNLGANDKLLKLRDKDYFVRPNGVDSSYLRYLLYLDDPADLTIARSEYDTQIENRQFDGTNLQWVGPNDILAESIYELPYEINENYVAVSYLNEQNQRNYRRLLLPIKSEGLKFIPTELLTDNMNGLVNNIEVRKIESEDKTNFTVRLTLPLQNGGTTVLRKEYIDDKQAEERKLVKDETFGWIEHMDGLEPFAFGIYPFVKTAYKNIYKILLYNHFKGEHSAKFYHTGYDNGQPVCCAENRDGNAGECTYNFTNTIANDDSDFDLNCEYYHLEMQNNGVGLGFVEIDNLVGNVHRTALIVPMLVSPINQNSDVTVAIDLGTSNTYMAYTVKGVADIQQISTRHTGINNRKWNELTFLNEPYQRPDNPDCYVYDFKYREGRELSNLGKDVTDSDIWQNAQLNEFIPSLISSNEGSDYSFPIPTIINHLRIKGTRNNNNTPNNPVSLIHTSIPFAFYKKGRRETERYREQQYYDLISYGSNFKWFGGTVINQAEKEAFTAFVEELLFMVRSHLICSGYGVDNCKLIWSYPLAFDSNLVTDYKRVWQNGYTRYFGNQTANVFYTNESLTPIHDCTFTAITDAQLVVVADIGGGSTDVIGYKHRTPEFVTSFGFAGNALYLEGKQSDGGLEQNIKEINYFWKALDSKKGTLDPESQTLLRYMLDKENAMSPIMNYCFSEFDDMEILFRDKKVKFLLLMHASSIVYHIAQLCHVNSPEEMPACIFFTGNGSKLLDLTGVYKQRIIEAAFKDAYGVDNIPYGKLQQTGGVGDKKKATVNGALKAMKNGLAIMNNNSTTKQCIMLGDKKTVYQKDPVADTIVDVPNYLDEVKSNVKNFINLFYDQILGNEEMRILYSKTRMLTDLEAVSILELDNGLLYDSLFFKFIVPLLQQVSYSFCQENH